MQTFVPYADAHRCASVLDRQRLGKQRVEAVQIARTLLGYSSGWSNHPAVKMWRGNEGFLVRVYLPAMMDEWERRGYKNEKCSAHHDSLCAVAPQDSSPPPWWGDERVHSSHRGRLLAKNPAHYSGFGWDESPDGDYYWPS